MPWPFIPMRPPLACMLGRCCCHTPSPPHRQSLTPLFNQTDAESCTSHSREQRAPSRENPPADTPLSPEPSWPRGGCFRLYRASRSSSGRAKEQTGKRVRNRLYTCASENYPQSFPTPYPRFLWIRVIVLSHFNIPKMAVFCGLWLFLRTQTETGLTWQKCDDSSKCQLIHIPGRGFYRL